MKKINKVNRPIAWLFTWWQSNWTILYNSKRKNVDSWIRFQCKLRIYDNSICSHSWRFLYFFAQFGHTTRTQHYSYWLCISVFRDFSKHVDGAALPWIPGPQRHHNHTQHVRCVAFSSTKEKCTQKNLYIRNDDYRIYLNVPRNFLKTNVPIFHSVLFCVCLAAK